MGVGLVVIFRMLCVIVNVMSESIIKKKTFDFAVRVVGLCRVLNAKEKEFVLSRQLLKSGTSIGANVREALNCHTKREFIYKLSISQRECDETLYWLELLRAANYLSQTEFESLHQEACSLLKIIRSIILTTKKRHNT